MQTALPNVDYVMEIQKVLSNCDIFVNTAYKRRHDRILQYIIFKFLGKHRLIESIPPWYTKVIVKPYYENDDIVVLWDPSGIYPNTQDTMMKWKTEFFAQTVK